MTIDNTYVSYILILEEVHSHMISQVSDSARGNQPRLECFEDISTPDDELQRALDVLPLREDFSGFSGDILEAHRVLLDPKELAAAKEMALRGWLSRSQPCVFGRSGSMGKADLGIDICMVSSQELSLGSDYLRAKIQRAREGWKDKAAHGLSSGFLIYFNDDRLARALPGPELVRAAQLLSELYLVEQGPIETDTIYTEAIPLRRPDGQLTLFKAGCNVFYTGAERTLNHDRRVPGGLLISMNSPGHYAASRHIRGTYSAHQAAIDFVRDLAFRSIGNGGIGQAAVASNSWHNRTGEVPEGGCPIKHAPSYIPADVDLHRYSALYHTDVLVPTAVMSDARDYTVAREGAETWPHLVIDYMTAEQFPEDHPNYGLFIGHPVDDADIYTNPWPARRAQNSELFTD